MARTSDPIGAATRQRRLTETAVLAVQDALDALDSSNPVPASLTRIQRKRLRWARAVLMIVCRDFQPEIVAAAARPVSVGLGTRRVG